MIKMLILRFILFSFFLSVFSEDIPRLVEHWIYSDSIFIKNEIIFCYNNLTIHDEQGDSYGGEGGLIKYKPNLSKIDSDTEFEFLSQNIEPKQIFYYFNNNSFIILCLKNLYIISNNINFDIIRKITPYYKRFLGLCVISEVKFLVLSYRNKECDFILCHYDIKNESNFNEANPTFNKYIPKYLYSYINCEKFILENKNYIFCLMSSQQISTFYNIFDENLNIIINEAEFIYDLHLKKKTSYIKFVQFSDSIIIALFAKYYEGDGDCENYFNCNSSLIAIEFNKLKDSSNLSLSVKDEINILINMNSVKIYSYKINEIRLFYFLLIKRENFRIMKNKKFFKN